MVADVGVGLRVLVVDDDDAIRRMLARVLSRRGFEVLESPDGSSALALLGANEVDVVLLDNGLPDIAGTEVLAHIRADPLMATLPVLLVTGRGDLADRIDGLEAGANDYLVKPVDLEELVARVRAQVRGRDAWRSQVEDALHQRAALAGAMAATPADAEVTTVGQMVVDQLATLASVRRAVLVEMVAGGEGHVLSQSGVVSTPGVANAAVPPAAMAEIRQAVSREAGTLSSTAALAILGEAQGEVAPFGVNGVDGIVAVLLLEVGQASAGYRSVLAEVSAAISDLLPVIERVLVPTLDRRHGRAAAAESISAVISQREFRPVYQPIIELATGRTAGFEALTRFDDGISPEVRFNEASRAGLGAELELATMEAAIAGACDLPAAAYLSLNVSAAVLVCHDLRPVLAAAGSRDVILELTEHERIDDYASVLAGVDALRPGVRLSVDDAGSGWASLRHVFALKPDFVKLDRGWVSSIETDPARQALLLGIARFVDAMEGAVVAEGIETESELRTLRSLEIHFGQGYFLGRPAPKETWQGG